MATEQYHEPPEELSQETRTLARMLTSLIEEAEAINWYQQRISVEKDSEGARDHAKRAERGVQALRHGPGIPAPPHADLARGLKDILFTEGDIVERGEEAEDEAD